MPCAHNGFPGTLTEAIRQARSNWVALLDADDWFAPDKLAVVAAAITRQACSSSTGTRRQSRRQPSPPRRQHEHPHRSSRCGLDLLPVTKELFFHVLDHLGHGVKLTDPPTCYRVHDSNMTDRTTPETQHDYMQRVSMEVAARLREMAQPPPPWASSRSLQRLARHLTARASAHAREVAIQRGSPGRR